MGLRIQLLSDLHLEAQPDWSTPPTPGADVLVLAGDIGSYQRGSGLREDDFGLGRFAPARGWPTPVLYVPGNHEFDGLDFDLTRERLRGLCGALGITWLDDESVVLGGVRFIGNVLWADFDALASREPAEADRLRQREKAMRAADFYLARHHTLRCGQPLLAAQMRAVAQAAQSRLRERLAQPHDGPTVVVTHFAPSLRSADPRYGLAPGTAGFCNALDALLDEADLWLHGHLHCPSDYLHRRARGGHCRVVANPLGYAAKGEQGGWRADWLIEVPDAP